MGKQIEAKEQLLSDILLSDSGYDIPWYQRPYAWEEKQVTEMFDDLYRSYKSKMKESYFLGSIVLTEEQGNKEKSVIDGQQRLTTLTILFACITYHIKKNEKDDKDDTYEKLLMRYIINPGDATRGVESRPRLNIRERDRGFFEEYIHALKFDDWLAEDSKKLKKPAKKAKKDKLDPKKLIKSNSILLLKFLETHFKKDNDDLQDFVNFLNNECSFVVISTPNKATAARVFSVMNSRGLDLQPTDIIKADIMGNKIPSDSLTNLWEEMEDKLGRDAFNSLFFYVRMIRAKKKPEESILKEFNKHFFNDIKKPSKLIKEILKPHCDALSMVRKNSYEAESDEIADAVNNYLYWLGTINNSEWIPPAIQFLAKYKDNPDYILHFFKRLERLFTYLYICGKSDNRRIERYASVIGELEGGYNLQNPPHSLDLTAKEKQEMLGVLKSNIYELPSQKRNYIIRRLDSFMSDGGAIYNSRVPTIEHVLPQNPNKNSEWVKKWNDDEREEWLHKLANLILLNRRRNSEAQNYDFGIKKSSYYKGKKDLPPYLLTSTACQEAEWTPTIVKARQEELIKVLTDNWELA